MKKSLLKNMFKKNWGIILSMNKNQLKTIIGLMTRHDPIKEHLHKIDIFNEELLCRLCQKKPEISEYILYNCESLDF